jgi:hypothetical protein
MFPFHLCFLMLHDLPPVHGTPSYLAIDSTFLATFSSAGGPRTYPAPHSEETYWLQAVAAAAILWNVELATT